MTIVIELTEEGLTLLSAPPGTTVEIRDYTAPEDWGGLETDSEGYKYQKVILNFGDGEEQGE